MAKKLIHNALFETTIGDRALGLFERLTRCAIVPLDHIEDGRYEATEKGRRANGERGK